MRGPGALAAQRELTSRIEAMRRTRPPDRGIVRSAARFCQSRELRVLPGDDGIALGRLLRSIGIIGHECPEHGFRLTVADIRTHRLPPSTHSASPPKPPDAPVVYSSKATSESETGAELCLCPDSVSLLSERPASVSPLCRGSGPRAGGEITTHTRRKSCSRITIVLLFRTASTRTATRPIARWCAATCAAAVVGLVAATAPAHAATQSITGDASFVINDYETSVRTNAQP